jgi:hypothetical protein
MNPPESPFKPQISLLTQIGDIWRMHWTNLLKYWTNLLQLGRKKEPVMIEIKNTHKTNMHFYLEPEGQDFIIPSGETALLVLKGGNPVGELNIGIDGEGMPCASFWTCAGEYEVIVQGRDAWDLIIEKNSIDIYSK